jgi:hypothetical protein
MEKKVSSQPLVIICNVMILVGGVIAVLATFGSFYFKEQVQKEKDKLAVAKEIDIADEQNQQK